ncbi:MAG: hypothetical protein AB7O24_10095 [Kofleriaceae bacterium]
MSVARFLLLSLLVFFVMIELADAAEVCGNGADDDSDGTADEGCYPGLTTGQCESPLSCAETGIFSPSTGTLHYSLPPDVAPKVPYGPGIGFRRFYTSAYAPGGGAPVYRKALGDRWQHTYMTWLDKNTTPNPDQIILHTNRGQDVLWTYASTSGGWDTYTPQSGFHVTYLRQRTTSPNEYQLRTLTGETMVYNSSGKLIEIWDSLAAPNKVLVAYDGNGQVSTVTDASGKRRLLFSYTSSKLSSLEFQIYISSTWTTQHTTTYAYSGANLTTISMGGNTVQSNLYDNNYLGEIQNGAGDRIIQFASNTTDRSKVARISTSRGMIGLELNSARTGCTGNTVLYFNLGKTPACTTDGDCGAGFMCGGKQSSGATGRCFRAARCLTISSPSEDVVTTVTPIGPPSESCDGACTDIAQYVWNTGGGALDLGATQDPIGNYISRAFDSNGMPTTITYGDSDTNPATGGSRTEWRYYGDSDFPGKVTEIRRKSDLSASAGSCTSSVTTGCARTVFDYTADGKLDTITYSGTTLNSSGTNVGYSYIIDYTHDAKGRLTQIDVDSTGISTEFEYWTPTGALSDDFLKYHKRANGGGYTTTYASTYDFWGNPTSLQDPDSTFTCLEFDTARGYLKKRTEAMAGQGSCSSPNGADLVTSWARDTSLRLTQLTLPDGSCMLYEYNATSGTLTRTKRRDDCNAGSSGDSQDFTYDDDRLLTNIYTKNAAGTVIAKEQFAYFDSRRLQYIYNPADLSKFTGFVYDSNGELSEVNGAGSLSKIVLHRDSTPGADRRVTSVDKYKTASTFDTWNLLYDWIGNQFEVSDPDSKETQTVRDDLGRVVKLVSPDMTYPVINVYDAANRLTTKVEGLGGGAAQRTHSFSYDQLSRPLNNNYSGWLCGGTAHDEIQRVYDTAPGLCPISGGCNNTEGRLAYEKVMLLCDTSLGDRSIDQETYYSYDDAGRVVREHIEDDTHRVAAHEYAWTKNGALSEVTTPSGAVIGWTYGSGGSNSDTDRATALWRTSTGTPVIDSILWNPYGPLQQYNQQNAVSGTALRTRITRNLAYRITALYVEGQTGGTIHHSVTLTEDNKGRVTKRDYFPNTNGVTDSWFIYDHQDRVVCENTTNLGSCPTSGSNFKNSHSLSPPFTAAGDWKRILRPIPGSTGGLMHDINPSGYGSSHQVALVRQNDGSPQLGDTEFLYDAYGNRIEDDNISTLTHDNREYYYFDGRHNVNDVFGQYKSGATWYYYDVISAFDAKNRRVYKAFDNPFLNKTASYFFYYDALDRLTEVKYTPDTTSPLTYSLFQLFWLDDRLVMYWQTDYPSVTTSKRYVGTDETGRPIDMMDWPSSGSAARIWAINPSAFGHDTPSVGGIVYQPILLPGQYRDQETRAFFDDATTIHRSDIVLETSRSYDAFVGGFLQVNVSMFAGYVRYGRRSSIEIERHRATTYGFQDLAIVNMIHGLCPQMAKFVAWKNVYVMLPVNYSDFGVDHDSQSVGSVYSNQATDVFDEGVSPLPPDTVPWVRDAYRVSGMLSPVIVDVECRTSCLCNGGEEPDDHGFICRVSSEGPWKDALLNGPPRTTPMVDRVYDCNPPTGDDGPPGVPIRVD